MSLLSDTKEKDIKEVIQGLLMINKGTKEEELRAYFAPKQTYDLAGAGMKIAQSQCCKLKRSRLPRWKKTSSSELRHG